jgi:hypothetical protein
LEFRIDIYIPVKKTRNDEAIQKRNGIAVCRNSFAHDFAGIPRLLGAVIPWPFDGSVTPAIRKINPGATYRPRPRSQPVDAAQSRDLPGQSAFATPFMKHDSFEVNFRPLNFVIFPAGAAY